VPRFVHTIRVKTTALPFGIVLLLLLLVPVISGAHSAVESAPRTDRGWQDRQELLNKRAAEAGEKAQVIFIGDSITQGWEGEGKDVWAKYYAPRNAVNLGIGGDRTQHVLWRLDNGNLAGLKPKAAVVMIGTNNSNGEDNTPDQIVDGVTAIVKKLREKLPSTKILLVAIFPRNENFSVQRGKLAMINQVLAQLGDNKDVFWVDFGHKFLNADGTMPRELMPDYLHLSRRGYEIWAEAIEPKLSEIFGSGAASSFSGLGGKWTATLPGPNNDPVDIPLTLKVEGSVVTGSFTRGEGRELEIRNGKVDGDEFSWVVERDRSAGGTITYRMKGRLEGNKLVGKAETELDGAKRTIEWSAQRR
jgi:lysophospholipase L1-like esterase